MDKESLRSTIVAAFSAGVYPGDWCLKNSTEGEEPFMLEAEFKGKKDWRALTPEFLDRAPGGLGSALGFFSDEAFRFYLPAYLIADLDGKLEFCDVKFYLTGGLCEASKRTAINPKRYGERSWWEYARFRFSVFSQEQCAAIAAYLRFKLESPELSDQEKVRVGEAVNIYWEPRSEGLRP